MPEDEFVELAVEGRDRRVADHVAGDAVVGRVGVTEVGLRVDEMDARSGEVPGGQEGVLLGGAERDGRLRSGGCGYPLLV